MVKLKDGGPQQDFLVCIYAEVVNCWEISLVRVYMSMKREVLSLLSYPKFLLSAFFVYQCCNCIRNTFTAFGIFDFFGVLRLNVLV